MKKLLTCLLAFACAGSLFAQKPSVDKMNTGGTSASSEESRYVLSLVNNNYVDQLNKYFDAAPWKTQTVIDAYVDSNKAASVSIFCAAVDLGNIEVVKAFLEHGYGPANLCQVQLFTKEKVVVSKADYLFEDKSITEKSSSASSSAGYIKEGWFGSGEAAFKGEKSSSSSSTRNDIKEKYTQVWYQDKTVVKNYFANPLDFASGKMFDYLWSKGFRSNNLFNKQALSEAKRLGREDIVKYIMDNAPESLSDKPVYISEADYKNFLKIAQKDYNSLAFKALERDILGGVNTTKDVDKKREELNSLMRQQLNKPLNIKADGLSYKIADNQVMPTDTLGYGAMDNALLARKAALEKDAAYKASKPYFKSEFEKKTKKKMTPEQVDFMWNMKKQGYKNLENLATINYLNLDKVNYNSVKICVDGRPQDYSGCDFFLCDKNEREIRQKFSRSTVFYSVRGCSCVKAKNIAARVEVINSTYTSNETDSQSWIDIYIDGNKREPFKI